MSKLLNQDTFTAYLEAATEKAGFTVIERERLKLHVLKDGETIPCSLRFTYQAYKNAPDVWMRLWKCI